MAARWSSEHVVAEYRDLQANSMAVDCTGQYALLASKRTYALVDLDKPLDSVKKVTRNSSKWEVSAVQWNPHSSHAQHFVTASNQRADVCIWGESPNKHICSLKSHTRVISDLDWSLFDANIIATCSVDTYTYLWDIRDTRKPTVSLHAVAGVSQVKWNKVNENLLATTHDGDIRIWDKRKAKSPVQYIAAHLSKIHGLDWCPGSEVNLATSSQDCTVKFWDVTSPRKAESVLSSGSPVWRARYTPFGKGLVTVVVPQLRRGENSLFLWYITDMSQPIHTFVGHTDVVLEFQWRKQSEDSLDFQLVTWSKDQSLRLWRIEPNLQKLVGYDVLDEGVTWETVVTPGGGENQTTEPTLEDATEVLTESAADDTLASSVETVTREIVEPLTPSPTRSENQLEVISPHQPRTLHQEFSLVNINIPNVTVDEMDAFRRTCTVSAVSGKHMVQLILSFPAAYPNNAVPGFKFTSKTTLDKTAQTSLIRVLRNTSTNAVKHNRSCLEPCLRQLINTLDDMTVEERKTPDSDTPYNLQQPSRKAPSFLPIYNYGAYQDAAVPFPRTSGARFCGAGSLVCFTRNVEIKHGRTITIVDPTPRALSALSAFSQTSGLRTPQGGSSYSLMFMSRSPPTESGVALSNYYLYKDSRKSRTRTKSRLQKDSFESKSKEKELNDSLKKKEMKAGPVIVYDTSVLLPIHKQLAENYSLDKDNVPAMCNRNANAAAAVGRRDLAQIWSLAALASSKTLQPNPDPDKGPPWAFHPFGRKMIKSILEHYMKIYDVQTLALLCCTFGEKGSANKYPNRELTKKKEIAYKDPANYNAYHTIHPTDTTLKAWNIMATKIRRSNSWSEFEDYKYEKEVRDQTEIEREQHLLNSKMLDPARMVQYDQFKKAYANILYRWQMYDKRAEILKYVSTPPEPHQGIEFVTLCQYCHNEARGAQCWHCKNYVFQCAICHIAVKGSSSFCLSCGHGGHSMHIKEWFRNHNVCPTGCKCECIINPMGDFD